MKAFYVLVLVVTLVLSEVSEARWGCRARASGGSYTNSSSGSSTTGWKYYNPDGSITVIGSGRDGSGRYWTSGTYGGGSFDSNPRYYSPSHGYTESSYSERTTIDIRIHSEIERSSRSFSSW